METGGEDKEPGCESVRQKIKLLKAVSVDDKEERKYKDWRNLNL